MMMPSSASLSEIKDLLLFARDNHIVVGEALGVRWQFSPLAFERPKEEKKEKPKEDPSPYGHYDPEAE
jgi:hypothetical protein